MATEVQSPSPAKYMRYKSVRQAAAKSPPPISDPVKSEAQNEAIQRSMSRYRRRPRVGTSEGDGVRLHAPSLPPPAEHMPSAPNEWKTDNTIAHDRAQESRPALSDTRIGGVRETGQLMVPLHDGLRVMERSPERTDGNGILQSVQQPPRLLPEEHRALLQPARTEEDEVARLLAEQKRKDLERLEMELAAATARDSSSAKSIPAADKFVVEKFGIFTRKSTKSKSATLKPLGSKLQGLDSAHGRGSQEKAEDKSSEAPPVVLQAGGGAVPGIDAPKSAVNAGDRVRSQRSFKQG